MLFQIEGPFLGMAAHCEPILHSLPQWFGMESALAEYVKDIEAMPTFVAKAQAPIVGFLTVKRHNEYAAELYVMGIRPEFHRKGIGRKLVERAEAYLKRDAIEFLQVKTLGPSRQNEAYEQTRAFYAALGFRPLEEFKNLWSPENPCLVMVKRLTV
jgi:ribosomal protein S18 acetylase RimI-like enzyme